MFRRRTGYSRPATRSGYRSKFRRSGLRYAREPSRWEVCNLVFQNGSFVTASANTFTGVVAMAMVFDRLGDQADGQGRAITNAVRALEIGGVVLSWRIFMESSPIANFNAQGTGPSVNQFDHRVLICSDRVDNAGNPNSVPDWFAPGIPLTSVSTTTPAANADDIEFPLRIHHQWHRGHNNETYTSESVSGGFPQTQFTEQLRGSCNLRLRLRLQDDTGLFFHFATRILDAEVAAPAGWAFAVHVVGTMYYRFRL